MKPRKLGWLGVIAALAIAQTSWGQAPPPIPGGGGIPAGPIAAPAAPAPSNLWSFLLPSQSQCQALKTCFCNSGIGQLASSAMGPISAMTGGLVTNCCAQNAIANGLNQPATSSEGAAALVKKDEADAKARRAAVRYLGTVDCSRWPEAEMALILSLRKDRNECVRFEAALALRSGCCCTPKIIKALELTITGGTDDGAPPEKSERVRAAAAEALAHCPQLQAEPVPVAPEKELKKVDVRPSVDAIDYYQRVAQMPREQVQARARAVLTSLQQGGKPQTIVTSTETITASAPAVHPRPAGLVGIFSSAINNDGPVRTGNPDSAREPFFSNLTKALTGRQEGQVIVSAPVIAAPTAAAMPGGPAPAPLRMAEPRPLVPAENRAAVSAPETNAVAPTELRITTPPTAKISEPTIPSAGEPRPAAVQTIGPADPPRGSSGTVEVEMPTRNDSDTAPQVVMPSPPRR